MVPRLVRSDEHSPEVAPRADSGCLGHEWGTQADPDSAVNAATRRSRAVTPHDGSLDDARELVNVGRGGGSVRLRAPARGSRSLRVLAAPGHRGAAGLARACVARGDGSFPPAVGARRAARPPARRARRAPVRAHRCPLPRSARLSARLGLAPPSWAAAVRRV
jgi:hypothetical protein